MATKVRKTGYFKVSVPNKPGQGASLLGMLKDGGVFIDVKSALSPEQMERGIHYWSL